VVFASTQLSTSDNPGGHGLAKKGLTHFLLVIQQNSYKIKFGNTVNDKSSDYSAKIESNMKHIGPVIETE